MKPQPHQIHLPKLAFGERGANVIHNIEHFMNRASLIFPKLRYYDAVGESGFSCKSSSVTINELTLFANVNTPVEANVGESSYLNFMMSFYGNNTSSVENEDLIWGVSSKQAVFLPKCERGGVSTTRSNINFVLQPERLFSVCKTMTGTDISIDLTTPRSVPLIIRQYNFSTLFYQLCQYIDSSDLDAALLNLIGLDDVFYRHIAILLQPEILLQHYAVKTTLKRHQLDDVCDYIEMNLTHRITLTDLEQLSGLNARSLQYAFKARFGCSPIQYIIRKRLDLAFQLIALHDYLPISTVANHCGFVSQSKFSEAFRQHFGILPSMVNKKV